MSRAIIAWIGMAQRTSLTSSSRPLFGTLAARHLGSLFATQSMMLISCAAVCFLIVRGRPKYLHGYESIGHPSVAVTRCMVCSSHLHGFPVETTCSHVDVITQFKVVMLRKARWRRLPEDGIRFSPPCPRLGSASSVVGEHDEVCLR